MTLKPCNWWNLEHKKFFNPFLWHFLNFLIFIYCPSEFVFCFLLRRETSINLDRIIYNVLFFLNILFSVQNVAFMSQCNFCTCYAGKIICTKRQCVRPNEKSIQSYTGKYQHIIFILRLCHCCIVITTLPGCTGPIFGRTENYAVLVLIR